MTRLLILLFFVCFLLFVCFVLFSHRSVGAGKQCRQGDAHRPNRLDAVGGFHKGLGCESARAHRCDPPVPASAEESPGQSGKRCQCSGETVTDRWRLLPVQIWSGSVL